MLAILLVLFENKDAIVKIAKKKVHSLQVIGDDPTEDSNGVIPNDPLELLLSANTVLQDNGEGIISLDEYSLARAIQSEHGDADIEVKMWVAWAIRNAAGGPDKLHSKLTKSKSAGTSGLYAHQNSDVGRYASTAQSPDAEAIEVARTVARSMSYNDPTHGATNFFSPKTQDYGYAQNKAGNTRFKSYTKDAAALKADWARKGLVSVGQPSSAAPREVEFFRQTGVA